MEACLSGQIQPLKSKQPHGAITSLPIFRCADKHLASLGGTAFILPDRSLDKAQLVEDLFFAIRQYVIF